ncbi:MAG: hypothetical protein KAH96_06070 [Alphaproteobacteria bacterium]|nr:hypothetical protein [Alphaproteobacteria bacterium]
MIAPEDNALAKMLKSRKEELKNEAKQIASMTGHPAEKGRSNEQYLMSYLKDYLPSKMGVGTGFIETIKGKERQSSQQDIIIFDRLHNAPLFVNPTLGIYPIEMVLSTIEVKTTLDKKNLKDALVKNQTLRNITKDVKKHFLGWKADKDDHGNDIIRSVTVCDDTPPRFFIFAYDTSYKSLESLCNAFVEVQREVGGHCDGLCVLAKDWFIMNLTEEGKGVRTEKFGWEIFTDKVYIACNSMHVQPCDRGMYLIGLAYD